MLLQVGNPKRLRDKLWNLHKKSPKTVFKMSVDMIVSRAKSNLFQRVVNVYYH